MNIKVDINLDRSKEYLNKYGNIIKEKNVLKLEKKTKKENFFELKKESNISYLLTDTTKNSRNSRFKTSVKILTLNLAPYYDNLCPAAGYCKDICIGISMTAPKNILSQIKKSELFLNNKEKFFKIIIKEIEKYKENFIIRLNNYSDIKWENINVKIERNFLYNSKLLQDLINTKKSKNLHINMNIFSYFPEILFYDYTKIPDRFKNYLKGNFPRNYFLTYSFDKKNMKDYRKILKSIDKNLIKVLKNNSQKLSIAFIVSSKTKNYLLKKNIKNYIEIKYKNIELIDGDKDDCRIFDLENQDRFAKIVLLEYNAKTGIKKNSKEEKYYLKFYELVNKIEEIDKRFKKFKKYIIR